MTNEDKKTVADYMGWKYWPSGKGQCYRVSENGGDVIIHFDLNDAGLVVEEMQKRGDWGVFINHTWSKWSAQWRDLQALYEFVFHLFNVDNFFKAFTEWRKAK
jgi:hypothetical protein